MKKIIRNLIAWIQTFMPIYEIKFIVPGRGEKEYTSQKKYYSLRDAKVEIKRRDMIYSLCNNVKIERMR